MKIKDLKSSEPNKSMRGVKVITPEGFEGYWTSQWPKGVWLSKSPTLSGQIHPIFVHSLEECLEWEIIEEETT